MIKAAALDLKLQPENGFILKVHYICNVHLEWLIGEQKVKERKRERERDSPLVRFRWYNWRSCFTFDTRSLSSASPGPVRPKSGKRLTERIQTKSVNRTTMIWTQRRWPTMSYLVSLIRQRGNGKTGWKTTHPSIFSARSNTLHAHISPSSIIGSSYDFLFLLLLLQVVLRDNERASQHGRWRPKVDCVRRWHRPDVDWILEYRDGW